MKAIYKKLTASASALTMLAASMAVGGVTASAIRPTSDYTISIPSTLDVTQAGWNELTGGISAKGSLGQHEKLVVSATSANDWALVSDGNRIGYNLAKSAADYDPNAETPTWEFEELNEDGVSQSAGVIIEDFEGKPRGQYTDTVTFKAEIVDTRVHLNGINITNETMNLVTDDLLSYGGDVNGLLEVEFDPENSTDDKTVTWTSSDEEVAKVDMNGNVTAVGTGDAVIKATVGEFSDTCIVSVNKFTINNTDYHPSDENFPSFTTDNGLINVAFGNPDGVGYYNKADENGWYADGVNSFIDISSNVNNIEIVKTRFSSKSGSAEITEAPFRVYSYNGTFHTGENGTGTHIGNEGGVNKIEVYVKVAEPKIYAFLINGFTESGESISETIVYTDNDTWADMVEKYDWLVTYDSSFGPDGKIIHHKTDELLEVKSSESKHKYHLVSINDKVSDYSVGSYYFGE